jgi:hypothetical protein
MRSARVHLRFALSLYIYSYWYPLLPRNFSTRETVHIVSESLQPHLPSRYRQTNQGSAVTVLAQTDSIMARRLPVKPAEDEGKAWPAIAIGLFVAFGGVLFG